MRQIVAGPKMANGTASWVSAPASPQRLHDLPQSEEKVLSA